MTRFLDGWIDFVLLDFVLFNWDRVLSSHMMLLCCCCCCAAAAMLLFVCCFCLWSFVSFVPSIAKPTTHQTLDKGKPPMVPQTPTSQAMESLSISSPDQVSASNSSNSTSEVMSVEEKFRIVRSVGEECIQENEFLNLLTKKPEPVCYDGFEPSG
ncbi:Tyrosine--tRNA ligase 2, cytoplasmic [Camellia lanceoleosa]|uniref:Tyrosine--tRNA ligase 2, cytoplasmic n=1 Tax=Camellia lanceoleosa TaxID=1840588 RepID=A0ACC0GZP4_9ERIC|nr:Tyrosine--tRNA ligase 2, cytoplasmic [Camellia lanceoleosa]